MRVTSGKKMELLMGMVQGPAVRNENKEKTRVSGGKGIKLWAHGKKTRSSKVHKKTVQFNREKYRGGGGGKAGTSGMLLGRSKKRKNSSTTQTDNEARAASLPRGEMSETKGYAWRKKARRKTW